MRWNLRSNLSGGSKYAPTLEDSFSDDFVGKLVRVLWGTAIHPSLIHGLRSSNLVRDHELGLVLEWPRTKHGRWVRVPVSGSLLPWLPEWLDSRKPRRRQTYDHILKRLAEEVEERTGRRIHLSALRLRHGAIVRWYHHHHLTAQEVCDLAGTTWRTIQTYATRPPEQVATKLREEKF